MSDQRRHAEETARARRQFQAALSTGQVHALDRFGQSITAGLKVLYRPPMDLVYDVVQVGPSLDPSLPPGVMTVTLTVTVPIRLLANQPHSAMVLLSGLESADAETTPPNGTTTRPAAVQAPGPDRDRTDAGDDAAPAGVRDDAADPADARPGVGDAADVPALRGDEVF